MRCEVKLSAPGDLSAAFVAVNARAADRAEFLASSGRSAEQVVDEALVGAWRSWTGWAGGEPVCVFGVTPWSWTAGVGIPWMVGTEGLDRAARSLLRTSRPAIDLMHARFPELVNYVDARNVRAIRWLWWLGFTLGPPEPHGVAGLPFHRFSRDSRHV